MGRARARLSSHGMDQGLNIEPDSLMGQAGQASDHIELAHEHPYF